MKINDVYGLEFARGLRSVSGYVQSLCGACRGACGEQPDDQCLISAWAAYIRAAEEDGHPAYEAGRRCALASTEQNVPAHNHLSHNKFPDLPCTALDH